jgi:hypothetical protein
MSRPLRKRKRRLVVGEVVPHVLRLGEGDVVAIPLPDRNFAFGRVFRGATIGIVKRLAAELLTLEELKSSPTAFHVGFFAAPSQKFDWIYLGQLPFANEDEAWPPPRYIEDIICPGTYRIYDRGHLRPAGAEEVRGLQKQVMLSPQAMIERIALESPRWPRRPHRAGRRRKAPSRTR